MQTSTISMLLIILFALLDRNSRMKKARSSVTWGWLAGVSGFGISPVSINRPVPWRQLTQPAAGGVQTRCLPRGGF